jgi:hypothetical protein
MNISLLHFVQGQVLRGGTEVFAFITPPPAKESVRRAGLTPLILRGGILKGFLFLKMVNNTPASL